MTQEQEAIAHLLAAFRDLLLGWPERELHEPVRDTIARGLACLPEDVRVDLGIPEVFL